MAKCPECGREVGPGAPESALAHAIDHWGDVPTKQMSKEARARKKQLLAIAEDEPKRVEEEEE